MKKLFYTNCIQVALIFASCSPPSENTILTNIPVGNFDKSPASAGFIEYNDTSGYSFINQILPIICEFKETLILNLLPRPANAVGFNYSKNLESINRYFSAIYCNMPLEHCSYGYLSFKATLDDSVFIASQLKIKSTILVKSKIHYKFFGLTDSPIPDSTYWKLKPFKLHEYSNIVQISAPVFNLKYNLATVCVLKSYSGEATLKLFLFERINNKWIKVGQHVIWYT